jgi:WD40 repeat protein/serine/threonine protein kinase
MVDATRIRSLFLHAVENHSSDQWNAFLDEACGADRPTRQRVEILLRAHQQTNPLLDVPEQPLLARYEQECEGPGMVIGPYQLLEQIGEGGFGIVYVAEQIIPVRRKVALKILKPGMDTRQIVARFEAERQALALMDHPNIAKVFDGGATPTGRPYFVMELVQGRPITEFCIQQQRSLRQRLELFIHVCQAVQHAHHKGIIHRDLKAANILVALHDTGSVVKIIDFGIVKALGQDLTDKTLYTGSAQMLGTPLYMSPEQAGQSGLDIDTRSDIYSLGVLLYELLTGTTPFLKERFQTATYDEIRQIICDEEPPKPSTRLTAVTETRTCATPLPYPEPKKSAKLVRGELDWIVMKALDKERTRRYDTANSFALDVQRYLADEPVLACPPSVGYRVQKFARRHHVSLLVASTMFVGLLTATAISTFSWLRTSTALAREASANERLETTVYFQTINLAEQARSAGQVHFAEQLLAECNPARRGWEWHYLHRLRYGQFPPVTHSSHLFCCAVSPDGQRLALGGSDGTITLRNRHTLAVIRVLEAHQSWARSLAFSPDGKHLVSGGWDRYVRRWDVVSGTKIWERKVDGIVQCVAFHPEGKWIAAAGDTEQIQFWDAQTGVPGLSIPIDDNLFTLQFSPDGQRLAGGGSAGHVRLWRTANGTLERQFPTQNEQILGLAFNADGRLLAAASGGFYVNEKRGELCLWETDSGERRHQLGTPDGSTFCVAFSPDGQRVVAGGSAEPTINVWDVASGALALRLRGHTEAIWSVVFSPDGTQLFSASGDRTMRKWDATPVSSEAEQEGTVLAQFETAVHGVAFHPNNRWLVTVSPKGTLQVWDVLTKQLVYTSNVAGTSCVAFSPDGKWLAAGSFGHLRIWDVTTWMLRYDFPTGDVVQAVSFHPTKNQLAAATGKTVSIWELEHGVERTILRGHTNFLLAAQYHPNGTLLASAGFEGEINVWNLEVPQPTQVLSAHIFPSSAWPALTNVWLWVVKSGLRHLHGHKGRVSCIAFSPNGKYLISAGVDGMIHRWEVATGQRRSEALGRSGQVHTLVFQPDGTQFASAGSDATIRVWDSETMRLLHTYRGHTNTIAGLAYSVDGNRIASASFDRTVRIWNAHPAPESPARRMVDPGR